jgi:hypothetical protein
MCNVEQHNNTDRKHLNDMERSYGAACGNQEGIRLMRQESDSFFSRFFAKAAALLLAVGCLAVPSRADLGETLDAFESKPGYVTPVATFMGTILNTGWNHTVRLPKATGFSFGLQFALAGVTEDDWYYTEQMETGCADVRQFGAYCPEDDVVSLKAPTLWGPNTNASVNKYVLVSTDGGGYTYALDKPLPVSDGVEFVRQNLSYLGLPFVQMSYTTNHTEFKGRWIGVPGIGENFGGMMVLGGGIQHDLRSFIKKELPVDLAISTNFTYWGLDFVPPKDDFDGTLELSGLATHHSLLVGKRFGKVELFSEIGWETSSMQSGGHIYDKEEAKDINPGLDVDGRNGFRMSVAVAFHLGGYHVNLGQSLGAQYGTTVNILTYRKEGSDE